MKRFMLMVFGVVLLGCGQQTESTPIAENAQDLVSQGARPRPGHDDAPDSFKIAVFSPDGKTALSADMNGSGLILWDLSTGKPIRAFGEGPEIRTLAMTPDGKQVLAGDAHGTLSLWDLATGKQVRTLQDGYQSILALAISPDGKYALAAGMRYPHSPPLILWELATGRQDLRFEGNPEFLEAVAFSHNGKRAITGGLGKDQTVKLWDIATAKVERVFTGQPGWSRCVAFSPDDRWIVSGSDDIKLWDAARGHQVAALADESTRAGVRSLTFLPDGRQVLFTANDGNAGVWDTDTGRVVRRYPLGQSVCRGVLTVDGTHALFFGGKYLGLWDVQRAQEIYALTEDLRLPSYQPPLSDVRFAADGKTACWVSADEAIQLWDRQKGRVVRRLRPAPMTHTQNLLALSADGHRIAAGCRDQTVRVWDVRSGELIRNWKVPYFEVGCLAFSADGKQLLGPWRTGEQDYLRLWDVDSGKVVRDLGPLPDGACFGTFLADGPRAWSACRGGSIFLWDLQTGAILERLAGEKREEVVSWHGDHIAISFGPQLRVRDVQTGQVLLALPFPRELGLRAALSPDGTHLLYGSGARMVLVHVASGKVAGELTPRKMWEGWWSVSFAPDGRLVHFTEGGRNIALREVDRDWLAPQRGQ